MELFVITQEWETEGVKEFELLVKGYKTFEEAKVMLDELFEDEKANGWFDEHDENTTISTSENGWSVVVGDYEKWIDCYINKIIID